ncbi:MAG: Mov34/MPN/PAD-1 family protein, partial [Bacillota bacterium]
MRAQRKWAANDGKYFLEISPSAWRFLEFECSKANNRETGGILIGYYSNDHSTAIITEASSPPPDSTYGYNWFWRGIAGLRLLLFQHWRDTRCKTYYIGEWHYHPSVQIIPSSEDFNQMQAIRDLSNYKCREPILLIVGKKNKGAMQLRAFVFPSGKQLYE